MKVLIMIIIYLLLLWLLPVAHAGRFDKLKDQYSRSLDRSVQKAIEDVGYEAPTLEELEEAQQRRDQEHNEWLMDQEDYEKIIGNCAIHDINSKNRACSCGITIGEKEYQNKGYGTEAMEMLVEYGFNTLNMNRIELSVYDFNSRAFKTYQKVGFVEEGRKRQARYHNGKYQDEIIMAILRKNWQTKGKKQISKTN